MNITIDTEKLWDFVRDAYEEAATAKPKGFYGWSKSETRKQVEQFVTLAPAGSGATSLPPIEACERAERLEQTLAWALDAYAGVCGANTSESWDAEEEQDVIDARRLLSGA